MNAREQDFMKKLLQQALPPEDGIDEPSHDLWPAVLRKLDEKPAPVPWFDWALIGGLTVLIVSFPAAIPMLLYYL